MSGLQAKTPLQKLGLQCSFLNVRCPISSFEILEQDYYHAGSVSPYKYLYRFRMIHCDIGKVLSVLGFG